MSAGTIERGARAPVSVSSRRHGISPRRMYGSSTSKVAPSTPMRSVGATSHLLEGWLAVLADERHELRDGDVALLDWTLAELLEPPGNGSRPFCSWIIVASTTMSSDWRPRSARK